MACTDPLTAFSAFESQLKTLCLKEFPCGIGTWVRNEFLTTFSCDSKTGLVFIIIMIIVYDIDTVTHTIDTLTSKVSMHILRPESETSSQIHE